MITIHPFLNGNKRTAYELVRLFLISNHFETVSDTENAYDFLLKVGSGSASEREVERWIARHLIEKRN